MPPFPKPAFDYSFDLEEEIQHLRSYKRRREVPRRRSDRLLIATWNIANFGLQEREEAHLRLIAEIIRWFDLIALQEVNDNFGDLEYLLHLLGPTYRMLFSDVAGNHERMAFLYRGRKVKLLEKIGEIAIPPSQHRWIKLPDVNRTFGGFDRNPYLATFSVGGTSFLLVNVHLFYGSNSRASIERRALETYAVARWADLRRKSPYSFTREIIALGDFNMPRAELDDPIFKALTRRGLKLPGASSRVGSSIASDNRYDQIAFFPGRSRETFTGAIDAFDFDAALFPCLLEERGRKAFHTYLRYYLSDHRPMWMELALP